jgi:chromosome condensin MukBEF MukE localization factor
MIYTFQISDETIQSQGIIDMLLTLSKENDFLKVVEEESGLTQVQEEELDRRYENFLKNPRSGKSWEEVKRNLMQE